VTAAGQQGRRAAHPAISVEGLTKHYGHVHAAKDVSFMAETGSVTGLLGPNGSGKTTTLRCLVGLVRPTSGRALIQGHSFRTLPDGPRRVGVLFEGAGLHPSRRVNRHLAAVAHAQDVSMDRIPEVLEQVGISRAAKMKCGALSLGMRQRLALGVALLAHPEVLILDEPGNGLDPEGIRWLRGLLRDFSDDGGAVLLSSHNLDEVGKLADDVVVLHRGSVAAHKSAADLGTGGGSVRVGVPRGKRKLHSALASAGLEVSSSPDGALLVAGTTPRRVGEIALRAGVALSELTKTAERLDLEDVFFEATEGSEEGLEQ
jgi:ABC-2 type transport system ATP-binding protein